MGKIVVDIAWLQELRSDMSTTRDRMAAASNEAVSLPSRPEVDNDATDFMNRWEKRRADLADCLDALDDILVAVVESFELIDQTLAESTAPVGAR